MSLVLHYKFDQPDVTIDSSSSPVVPTQVGTVTSSTDATYGTVAYFDGSSGFTLASTPASLQGSSSRTISSWGKRENITGYHYIYANTTSSNYNRFWGRFQLTDDAFDVRYSNSNAVAGDLGVAKVIVTTPSPPFGAGDWFHIVTTFDGTTINVYVNGVLIDTEVPLATIDTIGNFLIGHQEGGSNYFMGSMSDFRVYDGVIDATSISTLFSNGPNDLDLLDVTPFTHLADLEWQEISGASIYYLKFVKDGGIEEDITNASELTYVAKNLVPGSSYEFRVYSDLDLVTASYTKTVSTPIVDSTSVTSLLQRLENNLTLLSETSLGDISSLLATVLTTGDTVVTKVGSAFFFLNSESLSIPDTMKSQIITSFDQNSGPGQNVSVVLPDTSTSLISYNESSNEISVDGTSYTVGTSFILGGKKVTSKDVS